MSRKRTPAVVPEDGLKGKKVPGPTPGNVHSLLRDLRKKFSWGYGSYSREGAIKDFDDEISKRTNELLNGDKKLTDLKRRRDERYKHERGRYEVMKRRVDSVYRLFQACGLTDEVMAKVLELVDEANSSDE